jgi:hypothetical protein
VKGKRDVLCLPFFSPALPPVVACPIVAAVVVVVFVVVVVVFVSPPHADYLADCALEIR